MSALTIYTYAQLIRTEIEAKCCFQNIIQFLILILAMIWYLIIFLLSVKKLNQMTQNRVFATILQEIGGNGRYQTINLIIWSIVLFFGGTASFFNAFLFYQSDYSCAKMNDLSTDACHSYVCSLPEQDRYAFINNETISLASKFGDYRCEGKDELSYLQSFIYFGGILGVVSGVFLIQLMTKKKVIILTIVANFIGIIIAVSGPSIFIASFGLFINLAAKCCQIQVIVCYIVQSVDENLGGIHIMVTYTIFAIGVIVNGLFFKIIYHWENVLLMYLGTLLFALAGILLYVEEAPIDLILNYSPEYSTQVLKKIAKINNRNSSNLITMQEIQNIKSEYEKNQKQKHDYALSIIDLFRYDSLRMHSILLIILHFIMNFQFVAPQLALQDYELNIYLNGVIIGASQLIGSFVTCFMVNNFERKKVIYLMQGISLLISVLLVTCFSCKNKDYCSSQFKIIQSIGISVFRCCSTIGYNFYYLVQSEVFPAQIKGIGVQTTAISKHLAYICVPQIMYFCTKMNLSIITVFALSCILVALCIIKIPESFGIPPPEMIKELEYQHHDRGNETKGKMF